MIIKARARAGGSQLAAYLLNRDGEERAELLEMRGFDCFGGNLKNALIGLEIESKEHARQNPLYHVSFRLEEGAELTPEQWRECADRLEKNLDLVGNPRALVMHEENGEKHLHVVWSRTNDDTGEYNYLHNDRYKCRDTGRELEREFGTRQLPYTREQEHPTRADHEQAKRNGRDIHDIKAEIRAAWEQSDNGTSFENALADAGYVLAKGKKYDFMAVDYTGQEYPIGKKITGATAAQVRIKCADLDRDFLPTVEEARGYQQEQQRQHDQARAEREAEQKKQHEQAQKTEREALKKARDIEFIKDYGVAAFKELDQNRARQVDGYKIYDDEQLSEMAEAAAQQNQQERQQQARDLKRYDILKHEPPAQEQPAPTQKPRLKFDLDSQEQAQEDPAPVMTPEAQKKAYSPYVIFDEKGHALDVAAFTFKAPAPRTTTDRAEALGDKAINTIGGLAETLENLFSSPQTPQEKALLSRPEPPRPNQPAPRTTTDRAAALGDKVLDVAGDLLGGIGGPVTHEQTRLQAAGTQHRTQKEVEGTLEKFRQTLTPQEREAKAKEFDRAAKEATQAREGYKTAATRSTGAEHRAALRAEFRAEVAAKQAAKQAAILRETPQQTQEREAKEREEREAERRRRERQRER